MTQHWCDYTDRDRARIPPRPRRGVVQWPRRWL